VPALFIVDALDKLSASELKGMSEAELFESIESDLRNFEFLNFETNDS